MSTPASGSTGPLGQPRGVAFVIILSIITFGIYSLYWVYKTQEEMKKHTGDGLGGVLGLSILISVFGVVNTLVLSVFERTREIGMLRAVGMTRRQVRRMIRYEGIVTALIGGALGIAVGVFLAVLTTQALSDQGLVLAIPWRTMFVFVLGTTVVGLLASVVPARRASSLNILKALQYE